MNFPKEWVVHYYTDEVETEPFPGYCESPMDRVEVLKAVAECRVNWPLGTFVEHKVDETADKPTEMQEWFDSMA